MPVFLPQARPVVPGNANVANSLMSIGQNVGTAIAGARERKRNELLGEAAKGGDLNALRDTAFEQGRIGVGLQAQNSLDQKADRAEARAFRQSQADRSQANADRAFALQERQFQESVKQFAQANETKLKAIDAKANKLSNALSPGQKKADQEFAKAYVEFNAGGGFADVEKNLAQLEAVITELESDSDLTGPVRGNIPDEIGAFTEQGRKAINVREQVEEVVQRNLRLVLGAQFTQKEGERLIARAFNPRLEEKENAARVRRLIGQIKSAAQQKKAASEYFERNGTLIGFTGRLPSFNDLDPEGIGENDPANKPRRRFNPETGKIE